jgi:hypothetical protein
MGRGFERRVQSLDWRPYCGVGDEGEVGGVATSAGGLTGAGVVLDGAGNGGAVAGVGVVAEVSGAGAGVAGVVADTFAPALVAELASVFRARIAARVCSEPFM